MLYTLFPIWARGNLGEDRSNTAEHKRTAILKYIEEMNKSNEAYLDEYFDSDVIFHGATGDMNLEQFKAFHHQVLTAFAGATMTAEDIMVNDDKVVTRWRLTGNHQGPFMGIQPTGKDITISGIIISRFENGKVVEEWEEANIAGLMKQLGAKPTDEMKSPQMIILEQNKAIARKWFEEVINHRNLDAIDKYYSTDYVHHGPEGAEMKGLDEVRSFAASILEASNNRKAVVEQQVADGDLVVTRFVSSGNNTGSFLRKQPTGDIWTTEGIVISCIKDGKITEDWEIVHFSGL
jgi:predicted ester cyclase